MFSQTNAGTYKNVHLVKPCRVQRVCIGDGPFAPLDTCAATPVGPKRTIYADLAPLDTCAATPAGPKITIYADLAPHDTCVATPAGPKRTIYADLAPLDTCVATPAGPKRTIYADLARTLHRDKDECYVLICSI